MKKNPPSRPGITFEVGARLEAQDYLQKWYTSKIEKIDYEEGKVLIHFERWSSRYDEWILWDSSRIRPLERPALRKEGLKDEEENIDFNEGEEVLARWTDCRYYPAKIEAINKEGTYTVQFYDGVIRCLKKMHIKSMPEDAKGQDWIALVKVAAAAAEAKNKAVNKPRTSVNSNKDKEDRKWFKGTPKKEEPITCIFFKEEEEPTSSSNLEISVQDPSEVCIPSQDSKISLKRKLNQTSSFQAKRARLNKITGLLASKAVGLEDAEKKDQVCENAPRLEEAISPKPQKPNEADISHSCNPQKTTLIQTSISSGKARNRKDIRDLGDVSGCKKFPISPIAPEISKGVPELANLSGSSGRKNQRRPQKPTIPLSEDPPCPSIIDGKTLQCNPQTPKDLSIAKVQDAVSKSLDKVEPLDLSCSAAHTPSLFPESSFRLDCPKKEKENIQTITYTSKPLPDARIASSSPVPSPFHALQVETVLPNSLKSKGSKKKKSSERADKPVSAVRLDKVSDSLQEKVLKKVNEKDKHSEVGVTKEKKVKIEEKMPPMGKKKDKDRKEKEKDHSKSKQKKKKKKKKKAKQHDYSDYEEASNDILDRCSSPVTCLSPSTLSLKNNLLTVKNNSFQLPRAILSVDLTGENLSDMEVLEDSSTESLILSGDEYNQEFDSAIFDESQDEEEALNEIVRCVCEMDEENGFMIQCEDCLCWQHSSCMGLVEDSIPEQYVCYICSDPPGQRWSAKYRYDKEWFNKGHLCGLSFVKENYSYLNANNILSTHHLLADVFGVTEILHGLQVKFGILKNKEHPDLRLWACPVNQKDFGDVTEKRNLPSSESINNCGQNHKDSDDLCQMEETYIRSEHSYQKPPSCDHKLNDPADSYEQDGVNERREVLGDAKTCLQDSLRARNEQTIADECKIPNSCERKGAGEQVDSQLQWQLNLLTHIENVQNDVNSRMDVIEKEVDVLESWLDFTGELEPPDPLGRLPQLKRRIKQLLMDMSKVQQIATICSV